MTDIDVRHLTLLFTKHALAQMAARGLDRDLVESTFANPGNSVRSIDHPHQVRVTGNRVVIVGEPLGGAFEVVTAYQMDSAWTQEQKDAARAAERARKEAEAEASRKRAAAAARVAASLHRPVRPAQTSGAS